MYLTRLNIYTNDNISHLTDLIGKLSSIGITINNVTTYINDLKFNYKISLYVKSTVDLDNIVKVLLKQDYITNIERIL